MFCSNLHMLLALARETPQVLAQLGISMAMLQKEQEDLQNVEKLKVGWFTEETQGGGKRMVGQGHHPATSCLSFLALSLVIRRALFVRGLYCKAHERFWFLLAIFQLTCETCTMPPAEMHAITGYHGSILLCYIRTCTKTVVYGSKAQGPHSLGTNQEILATTYV